jgi:hypothetical protein
MYELTPIIPMKLPDTERNVFAANSGHGLGPNQIQAIQDLFDQATNHNDPKITKMVKQQIQSNIEKYKSCGNTVGYFETKSINDTSGRKIRESITTRTPMKMGTSNGFEPHVIGIYYAYDKHFEKYREYGISPGDVFLWMQYENTNIKRETILSDTSKKECFCGKKKLESNEVSEDLKTNEVSEDLESNEVSEDLESNGAKDMKTNNGVYQEYLDPETANNVELMKSAILDSVERSLKGISGKVQIFENSRKITTKKERRGCNGIYVSEKVYKSLKRGGEIYEEVLRIFKVKLVVRKPPGRKRADADETMTRLCEISW